MNKLYRRDFMKGAAALGVAATSSLARPALAQQWPTQDLRFICGYAPGSGADLIVRHFSERVRKLSNANVIVENRTGAGGDLATEYVARAKPDGYTILIHGAGAVAGIMSLRKNPPIDTSKTLQMAATTHRQCFMVVVDTKSPYQTLDDLTKAMLAKGDKASYGTNAIDGTVIGEIYKNVTGIKAQEVPYRVATDTLNDLSSGALDFCIHNPQLALSQHRENRLRILGIGANKRMISHPEFPTMTELGVPMNIQGWWCASVPTGSPTAAINLINKWFVEIVNTEDTKKFLTDIGGDPLSLSPADTQALFMTEIENWREKIRIAKITPQ